MTLTSRSEAPAPDNSALGGSIPGHQRRLKALAIWSVAFTAWWFLLGLPLTDPILTFLWLWAATIAWRVDRPWRVHLGFARDWAAIVVLLQVYNLSRGFADQGVVPHAMEMVAADRYMFGWLTDGRVPTLWLQQHLYDPGNIHWWDVCASWVYFSHFVATPAVAVVLWLRDRIRWAAFVLRWILLSAAGLATYFLYPAAPPWWAARYGLIDPVERGSTRAWDALGLHGAGNLINVGQDSANPVAAMPSLHTAFALMVVAFFLPKVRRRWWPLLLAYPLAMTFTLVYSGEHYMIDVFMGWTYVGLVFVVGALVERWWAPISRARAARAAEASVAAKA
ncbi:inositol phosphorylceramide synthase [Planosporangium flavigriseum]|uniref:Phosphatidic acid phosphatase n=1 Tax=Planosporangium flavigriseum TaxID=373681 RepID=A0A8J3LTG9_9ACTN|nr:phosphatase PAP2 family protein [Planosporangium flavigriseum]NJC65363.1 inositol phosphorylceramide synthase [Planosporangium flavigriseum]GIG73281.1 phosphatidic acid phosphatase [Planosporangium flavigriseum]